MNKVILTTGMLLALPLVMFSQTPRNAAERTAGRTQVATGKVQLERDVQELEAFKAKMKNFDAAWAAGDEAGMARVKSDLLTDMKREIVQAENKLKQDRREVAGSKAEVRSDRREVAYDRGDLAAPGHNPGDRVDLRADQIDKADDKRDVRDDRRDYASQAAVLTRQREISAKIEAVQFRKNSGAAEKELLNEFVRTMEADLAFTRIELGEDRGELREDRVETRDDRREKVERRR